MTLIFSDLLRRNTGFSCVMLAGKLLSDCWRIWNTTQQHSTALPGFPVDRITELYDLSLEIGQTQMIRRFMQEIQ